MVRAHGFPGLALAALCVCVSSAGAETIHTFNVAPVSQYWFVPVISTADVWVEGDHAFVSRQKFGLGVLDISDPATPVLVETFNPGPGDLQANDIKVHHGYAYLSNESLNGVALYILDARDPTALELVGAIRWPEMNAVHNLWLEDDVAYITGNTHDGWQTHIYDVSDPSQPRSLAVLPVFSAHDVYVKDGVLYESGGWNGLHLWDVTDPTQPVELAAADENDHPRPHYHTHNAWPTADGSYVFTTNEIMSRAPGEIEAGGLKIWERTGDGLVQVGGWRPQHVAGDPMTTIHNVQVVGDFAFVSHYQAGIRVLDVTDPADPVEVGFAETFGRVTRGLFEGTWGVFATADGRICATDRLTGFHLLQFNGARRSTCTGEVVDAATGAAIPGAVVSSVEDAAPAYRWWGRKEEFLLELPTHARLEDVDRLVVAWVDVTSDPDRRLVVKTCLALGVLAAQQQDLVPTRDHDVGDRLFQPGVRLGVAPLDEKPSVSDPRDERSDRSGGVLGREEAVGKDLVEEIASLDHPDEFHEPRPLVRSYRTVSPLPLLATRRRHCPRRSTFCCTFPILADGGRYPPPCRRDSLLGRLASWTDQWLNDRAIPVLGGSAR